MCTVRRTQPNSAPTSACRQPDSSHKRKIAFQFATVSQRKFPFVRCSERKIKLDKLIFRCNKGLSTPYPMGSYLFRCNKSISVLYPTTRVFFPLGLEYFCFSPSGVQLFHLYQWNFPLLDSYNSVCIIPLNNIQNVKLIIYCIHKVSKKRKFTAKCNDNINVNIISIVKYQTLAICQTNITIS